MLAAIKAPQDAERLKSGGVYVISCSATGRYYIGATNFFGRRWAHHKATLNGRKHHSIALQTDWLEHGLSAFRFAVVEVVEPDAKTFKSPSSTERRYLRACSGPNLYNDLSKAQRQTAPNGEEWKWRSLKLLPSEWALFDAAGGIGWLRKVLEKAKPPK